MQYDDLVGTIVDERFELVERLGRGRCGVVYKANQPDLNRQVALKFFDQMLLSDPDDLHRFRQEGQILAKMEHPNILRCFMLGLYQGKIPYLAFEFVSGETLREVLLKRGRLPWKEAVQICLAICDALSYAEKSGVVHRDLKPENIMVDPTNFTDVKVLDFGLARITSDLSSQHHTKTGTWLGTPTYMSPEQCLGKSANCQSDIYSLGCILFELLDGKPPFEGDAAVALLRQHVHEPPREPNNAENAFPNGMLPILSKALAKAPENRFRSADELAHHLKALLSNKHLGLKQHHWPRAIQSTRLPATLPVIATIFLLCAGSLVVWFAVADPVPIEAGLQVVRNMHIKIPPANLEQAGDSLAHFHKPAGAALLFDAAASAQKSEKRKLELKLKEARCLWSAGDATAAHQLSAESLRKIEQLLQTQKTYDIDGLAYVANGFAKQLILHSATSNRKQSELLVQISTRLISLFQSLYAAKSVPAVSEIPDLYLWCLKLHADLKIPLPEAGEILTASTSAAGPPVDIEQQRRIWQFAERCLDGFPDRRGWAQLIEMQLRHIDASSIASSKTYNPVLDMAISSLQVGLPDDVKLRICMLATEKIQSETDRSSLSHALRQFVNSNAQQLKRFKSCISLIDAQELNAKGRYAQALSENLAAYDGLRFTSQASRCYVEPSVQRALDQTALGFRQNPNRIEELDAVMEKILAGKLSIPTKYAETLGRIWLEQKGHRDLSVIGRLKQDRPSADNRMDNVNALSLRALLLGLLQECATADKLFADAAQALPKHDLKGRGTLLLRRAEVEVVKEDFVSAERAARGAVLVLENSNERIGDHAKHLLFVASFCQGKIDFADCYRNPAKYGVNIQSLADAVTLKIEATRKRKSYVEARKLVEATLFLADNPSLEISTRLNLLQGAGMTYWNCGETALARRYYQRCLDMAVKNHLPRYADECRSKLEALR